MKAAVLKRISGAKPFVILLAGPVRSDDPGQNGYCATSRRSPAPQLKSVRSKGAITTRRPLAGSVAFISSAGTLFLAFQWARKLDDIGPPWRFISLAVAFS